MVGSCFEGAERGVVQDRVGAKRENGSWIPVPRGVELLLDFLFDFCEEFGE